MKPKAFVEHCVLRSIKVRSARPGEGYSSLPISRVNWLERIELKDDDEKCVRCSDKGACFPDHKVSGSVDRVTH